ncbi:hypothetical protein EW145_g5008 [Phellinidium pouzarii]|uniref:DUF6534 domain-containing protein n=1 Tax=Phellinidium pouzarii TaxID=167371 RepID=A0A4S4L1I1_9AGAM|nr:hypothetical protein EW145_g5008 [Phellinidium pouzarii]
MASSRSGIRRLGTSESADALLFFFLPFSEIFDLPTAKCSISGVAGPNTARAECRDGSALPGFLDISLLERNATSIYYSYMIAFILTAGLDILITCLMLWFLLRAKSQVVSKRLDKTLARLHRMLWEAAVPPCACAIAACIVYITMSLESLWDVFCQSILGKLYAISLFIILSKCMYAKSPSSVELRLTSVVDGHIDSDLEAAQSPTENMGHVDAEVCAQKVG